jgi:hypothetical protein
MTDAQRPPHSIAFAAVLMATLAITSCGSRNSVEGTFDKSLTVSGPVHLQVATGSGTTTITTGPPGEVRIHGDISVSAWSEESGERRVNDLRSSPPISQQDGLIRIGDAGQRHDNVSIDYTITVPPDTQLQSTSGSGDVEVTGIKGPANFTSGSGSITLTDIGDDVQIKTGSGDIELNKIHGQITGNAGSAGVKFSDVQGPIRFQTGSGDVEIENAGAAVEIQTGSGGINVKNASSDLRIHTSSGDVEIQGNPNASSYWDVRTGSGDVILDVSAEASLRLYAHTSSGDIEANIPISMEGTTLKHELRARLGDGKARVEVETSSGDITLK